MPAADPVSAGDVYAAKVGKWRYRVIQASAGWVEYIVEGGDDRVRGLKGKVKLSEFLERIGRQIETAEIQP